MLFRSGSVLFKTFFVRLFHLCVCVLFRFRPRRSSLMQRPPRGVRLRGLRVPVEASLDGLHGDALGRPPLVQGEQGLEQGVDVGLKALSLHPALQHLVHLVAGVGVLRDADVVVAHPDGPEELVVDLHLQVLVEEVETGLQRCFLSLENERKKDEQ